MLFLKIVAIVISLLYSVSSLLYATTLTVNAQSDLQTTKHRDMVIDLGNGLKTNAQLTIPAMGEGPFPGVIIFPGSGAGSVLPPTSPYSHMAEYLSEREALLYLDMIREVSGQAPRYQIVMHGGILHSTI